MRLQVNGQIREFGGDDDMPLLWYLREELDLRGAKFGCGIGLCGSCTVHLNGEAVRSCGVTMSSLDGARVTTIEGVANGPELHPVQQAWLDENVTQCGYCQAGQIMTVIALLETIPNPTDENIDAANTCLCRCGTYHRIRKAIHRAVRANSEGAE
ncbi:MAG: (2Fe-2S)-binding protein [Gemmatimonadales bacterium]|nr:(2Fe-2S)-binding protein [Gemmatimonadales bacterium]